MAYICRERFLFFSSVIFSIIFFISTSFCCANENLTLQPSFKNYAIVLPSRVALRANPILPATQEPPFSWTQTVVARENSSNLRFVGSYDPDMQQTQLEFLPVEPQYLNVLNFDASRSLMSVTLLPQTAGVTQSLLFRARARNMISDDLFTLIYDIRAANARIRGAPLLSCSPGEVIKPGQIARYTWTQTTRGEKRPKVEAEFSGRTGQAKALGLNSSAITEILAIKTQPVVLGHYLMTVTPRDTRGEPPRGSTSNGHVFLCAFGSENLAPITDGLAADTFIPAVSQTITISPIAVDPETGRSVFERQIYDFGDGVVVNNITGATTHSYAAPGIYCVRCALADDQGLTAIAEDQVIVGATSVLKLPFKFRKYIPPEEAGCGETESDTLSTTFVGVGAKAGDRIVFVYNRNRFGRMHASDLSDDTDIILKTDGSFTGATRLAHAVSLRVSGNNLAIRVSNASFDRTGDPRFGRADLKGIFKQQRIALCVAPADGSTPRVWAFTGNMQIKVKGGATNQIRFYPEEFISGATTDKEPDPRKQEVY